MHTTGASHLQVITRRVQCGGGTEEEERERMGGLYNLDQHAGHAGDPQEEDGYWEQLQRVLIMFVYFLVFVP